jgi:hypothetical protein
VESNQNHKRDEWLSALEKMESFKPRTVVAGHKNMKNDDDAGSLQISSSTKDSEAFLTFTSASFAVIFGQTSLRLDRSASRLTDVRLRAKRGLHIIWVWLL